MKYFIPILIALCIDALQALIALAISGAAFSATTLFGWVPVIGQGAAATIDILGMAVAVVLDVAISISFGGFFILALIVFFKLLTPNELLSLRRMPFILAKLVPFIGALPFFTGLAVACALRDMQKNGTTWLGRKAVQTAGRGASGINRLAAQTNRFSPKIARATGQQALSQGPELTPEETARGRAAAEELRPALQDIRPPQTQRGAANDNGRLSVNDNIPHPRYGIAA